MDAEVEALSLQTTRPGDFPALSVRFTHVRSFNLTGASSLRRAATGLRYLDERYAEQFEALEDELAHRYEALEDAHCDQGDAQSMARYEEAIGQLAIERAAARTGVTPARPILAPLSRRSKSAAPGGRVLAQLSYPRFGASQRSVTLRSWSLRAV